MANETFGASNTSKEVLAAYGALAGTAEGGKQAAALARQMYPDPEKANPWVATYEFFNAALQRASEPGQTTFGTFTGAVPAVMDYYTAKDKELAETERARLEAGFKLAPALKAGAGKITYRPATAAELLKYGGATAGQMGSDGKFYDLSKTPASGSNTTGSYMFQNPAAYERFKIEFPAIAEMLTDGQKAGTEPLIINKSLLTNPKLPNVFKEPPASSGDPGAPGMKDDGTGTMRYTGYNLPEGKKIGDAVFDSAIIEGFTENDQKLATTLRKDLTAALKEFLDIDSSMKNINSFYFEALEQANPISDYSLAVQYAKIIDPGTAAREGEVAAIAGAGSLSGALRAGLTNALLGTGKLSKRMRASIFNNSIKIYESKLPNALSTIKRYKTQSEEVATGLFKFVGLNIPRNEAGEILFRGVGGDPNENPDNYQPVDLANITDDPIDNDPIAIFPPNHSFDGYSLTTLLGFLALPPDTLDRETLNKIQKALENLQ
jgi:hypothetical protein